MKPLRKSLIQVFQSIEWDAVVIFAFPDARSTDFSAHSALTEVFAF